MFCRVRTDDGIEGYGLTGGHFLAQSVVAALEGHVLPVVMGSDPRDLERIARGAGDEVRDAGAQAVAVAGDLGEPESARRVLGEGTEAFGRLDLLVNNAAIRPEAPFAELAYEEWRRVMAIGLDAVFVVNQAALPHLLRSDNAAIVTSAGSPGIPARRTGRMSSRRRPRWRG